MEEIFFFFSFTCLFPAVLILPILPHWRFRRLTAPVSSSRVFPFPRFPNSSLPLLLVTDVRLQKTNSFFDCNLCPLVAWSITSEREQQRNFSFPSSASASVAGNILSWQTFPTFIIIRTILPDTFYFASSQAISSQQSWSQFSRRKQHLKYAVFHTLWHESCIRE